jgi:protease I
VVDGNLVSGRTYHDHGHYIGKWIELLEKARAAAPTKPMAAARS